MTVIALNLSPQDESMIIQRVSSLGISIEQFILNSIRKEITSTTSHNSQKFIPNEQTLQAIESARNGEVEHFATYEDMMKALTKAEP